MYEPLLGNWHLMKATNLSYFYACNIDSKELTDPFNTKTIIR